MENFVTAIQDAICEVAESNGVTELVHWNPERFLDNDDPLWQTIYDCVVGFYAEEASDRLPSAEQTAKELCAALHTLVEELVIKDWLASVPLERYFEKFPEHTDFGPFAIVNPSAGKPGLHRNAANDLIRILAEHERLRLMPWEEVKDCWNDSNQRVADSIWSMCPHSSTVTRSINPVISRALRSIRLASATVQYDGLPRPSFWVVAIDRPRLRIVYFFKVVYFRTDLEGHPTNQNSG